MSYQDPYDNGQYGGNDQGNNQYYGDDQGWDGNSGGQQQGDGGLVQDVWQLQQSQDSSQQDQWYGDLGHGGRSKTPGQKSIDAKNYQYPPLQSNWQMPQKSAGGLSKKSKPSVEVPVAVQGSKYTGVKSGFEKGEFTPQRRTPSAYREYRFGNQGNLWTKNGRLRTVGRFCLCTILTAFFLVVSIALSLVLWIRPPNVQIGQVQSSGGLQKLSSGGFQFNLSTVITVDNFNYFDVDMRKIQVEVFYPIENTPIGGGTASDVFFKSNTETNFTFPFALTYNPLSDSSGQVLADIATKCGVGGHRSDLSVNYQLTLGIQVLLFTVSPVISNVFTFACPIQSSDISKIFGGS